MSGTAADEPDRGRRRLPPWAIFAVLATLLVGLDVFAIILPNALMARRRDACADQLRRIGELLHEGRVEPYADAPFPGGARYLIRLVQGTPEGGQLLVCPGDPDARPYEELGLDEVALAAADDDVLRSICSYAAIDPVASPEASAPIGRIVVAADVAEHHQGGLHVLYADGTVEFLGREALGLSPTDEISVGPDAKREDLRPLGLSFERE